MNLKKIIAVNEVQGSCFGFAVFSYLNTVFPDHIDAQICADPVVASIFYQSQYVKNKSNDADALIKVSSIQEKQGDFISLKNPKYSTYINKAPKYFLFYFSLGGRAHACFIDQSNNVEVKIYDTHYYPGPLTIEKEGKPLSNILQNHVQTFIDKYETNYTVSIEDRCQIIEYKEAKKRRFGS